MNWLKKLFAKRTPQVSPAVSEAKPAPEVVVPQVAGPEVAPAANEEPGRKVKAAMTVTVYEDGGYSLNAPFEDPLICEALVGLAKTLLVNSFVENERRMRIEASKPKKPERRNHPIMIAAAKQAREEAERLRKKREEDEKAKREAEAKTH